MISRLRDDFHKLINSVNNEELLASFYETMNDHKNELAATDIIDELTEQQKVRLSESIQQTLTGHTLLHEEALKRIDQWRSK